MVLNDASRVSRNWSVAAGSKISSRMGVAVPLVSLLPVVSLVPDGSGKPYLSHQVSLT